MCQICGQPGRQHPSPALDRRRLFAYAAAAAALPMVALPGGALARDAAPLPKPANQMSPDAAFNALMEGNHRYAQGLTRRHDFNSERSALAGGQNPYAGLLGCADSRVAPEFAFDSFRGDLFVVRVAGNFVNDDNLASFEFGVAVLGVPLLMVLGHSACGAVKSSIASMRDQTTLPGHLPSLVSALAPAVKAAAHQPGDALVNATKENVRLNVARLKTATPILSAAVTDKKLMVVGGYYDLSSGKVEIVT